MSTTDEGSFTTATAPDQILVAGAGGADSYTVNYGSTLTTPITIAGSSTDTVNAYGAAGNNYFVKTPGQITWSSLGYTPAVETLTYSGIQNQVLWGGSGSNYFQDPGGNTTINGGPGANTVIITATTGNGVVINGGAGANTYIVDLGSLAGPVTVQNSNSAATNSLIVNGAAGDNTIAAAGNQITSGTQTITDTASLANLTVNGGSGNNQVTVSTLTVPVQNLVLNGGGGTNTFTLNNAGSDVAGLAITPGSGGPGSNQVQVQGSLPAASVSVPAVGTLSGPATAIPGQPISFTASYSVDGPASTEAVTWNWGDGTTTTQTVSAASGTLSATHVYAATSSTPYGATLTMKDNTDGLTTTSSFSELVTQSIYVLNAAASGALSVSDNAAITIPGTLVVDSSSNTALIESGNSQLSAASISVVGGAQKSGNAKWSPAPVTGAASVADPLAGLAVPTMSGSRSSVSVTGNSSLTIEPGIYSSISVAGNGKLTLNPGVYVIAGGGFAVSGNGTVSGSGVMIYNAGIAYPNAGGSFGSISFSGNTTIDLCAATSGPYAGMLIFQSRDNYRAIALSGNASAGGGTIYAAGAALVLSGNANLPHLTAVVSTLSLSGGAFQLVDGASSDFVSSTANQVLYGTLTVAVQDDTGNGLDPTEVSDINDAMTYLNSALGAFGVSLTWAAPGTNADVHIHFASSTPYGGAGDGVLGFTTASNDVYLVTTGWSLYTGSDPSQIGAGQYDFPTLATHELAHTVGLGESSDPTSVMYEYLAPGRCAVHSRIPTWHSSTQTPIVS